MSGAILNTKIQFRESGLLLRPIRYEDCDAMFALTQDENMWTYFTADLSKRGQLEAWIREAVENDSRLALTIVDESSNQIAGSTSIANYSQRDQRAEIGWTWIGKNFQGTGLNARVKKILLDYLFKGCQMKRVELKTDVLNIPARRALLKIGFVEEGILRSHTLMTGGRRRDTIYYSLLRSEWEKLQKRA